MDCCRLILVFLFLVWGRFEVVFGDCFGVGDSVYLLWGLLFLFVWSVREYFSGVRLWGYTCLRGCFWVGSSSSFRNDMLPMSRGVVSGRGCFNWGR